jgi:hypothetical protein
VSIAKRILALVALIVVFVIVNRGAVEGYFSDDDLDNLSWTTAVTPEVLPPELVTPKFSEKNVRPVGAYFYRWAGQAYGLDFAKYLPWLFGFHLLNGVLIWFLLRQKGCPEMGAWAGAVFFVFHAALLEAWWKPMYIFDLLCGTLLLGSWLSFRRWWWLSWGLFWLAYKAKEVALFFPVVLALDAFLLQQGRVGTLAPFFLTSLSFGAQAVLVNRTRNTNYTLRFGMEPLRVCLEYYWRQLGLSRYGTLLVAGLMYLGRERQVWMGALGFGALLVPLLFLPTRLFSVYLYVPLLPLTVGMGFVFAKAPRWALGVGMALWLGWNWQVLREKRNAELQLGAETRAYVEQLEKAQKKKAFGDRVLSDSAPVGLRKHGVQGALRLVSGRPALEVLQPEVGVLRGLEEGKEYASLAWLMPQKRLEVVYHRKGEGRLANVEFADASAVWQLGEGWHERDGGFRWMGREAVAYLGGNPYAKTLQVRYNIGEQLVSAVGKVKVQVYLDGDLAGESEFDRAGIPVVDYPLRKVYAQRTHVRFVVSPGYQPPGDGRMLGVAIWGFGFLM